MSSNEIWHFLKGQDSVGPFSKDILRQIHDGGQFLPETMTWCEGMAEWKPAGEISELADVFVKKETPPPPAESQISSEPAVPTAGGIPKPKLKLKSTKEPSSTAPASSPAPAPAAAAIPPPGNIAKPAEAKQAGLISEKEASALPPPTDPAAAKDPNAPIKDTPLEKPSFIKRFFGYIFSSLFLTPLFAVTAGIFTFLHLDKFPNVLGSLWLPILFGALGILSLFGLLVVNLVIRWLALLLFIPPTFLLWPVIMAASPASAVPMAHWIFVALFVGYGLTLRLGYREYPNKLFSSIACIIGLAVLGFIIVVAQTSWAPAGWDELKQPRSVGISGKVPEK